MVLLKAPPRRIECAIVAASSISQTPSPLLKLVCPQVKATYDIDTRQYDSEEVDLLVMLPSVEELRNELFGKARALYGDELTDLVVNGRKSRVSVETLSGLPEAAEDFVAQAKKWLVGTSIPHEVEDEITDGVHAWAKLVGRDVKTGLLKTERRTEVEVVLKFWGVQSMPFYWTTGVLDSVRSVGAAMQTSRSELEKHVSAVGHG